VRIYNQNGIDMPHKVWTFPDGQPHFQLTGEDELDDRIEATIETAIRSPQELFEVLQAKDVLGNLGYNVSLDVRYLLGARMDRAIDSYQPFTLQIVARLINGAGFNRVRILDAHSEIATRLIRRAENILPFDALFMAAAAKQVDSVVIPDKGAIPRVMKMFETRWPYGDTEVVTCNKTRDMASGNILKFSVINPDDVGKSCLIVDDICDGGGTFTGLAKELRAKGAKGVNLFVTHGIFSKGIPLEGVDHVYCTDSYIDPKKFNWETDKFLTVIPVSMKDMK